MGFDEESRVDPIVRRLQIENKRLKGEITNMEFKVKSTQAKCERLQKEIDAMRQRYQEHQYDEAIKEDGAGF